LTTAEEATVRTAEPLPWTAADRSAFELLLSAGARGRSIFGQLDTLGWTDRAFPEWRAVATAPQLAPFHDHPVGTHLHRTVTEMVRLIHDGGDTGAMATDVSSSEELILAAFLHDIGKARGGDHASVGARLASNFLRRSGFGPATVASVSEAVRLHLLLPETATRRDIADPAVIDEVADAVGGVRQLKILYLLAIADLRATGTTMWNPWRSSLLNTLYLRVLDALETGEASPASADVGAVVMAAVGDVDRRSIEEHVASMPDDYLDTTAPLDVLWHLRIADRVEGPAVVAVDPGDPGRVLVVGADRAGFLLAVSRAFAANGVGVLDARLRTRADGVAIDTFSVVEDRNQAMIPSDRWLKVGEDLNAELAGGKDLRPEVQNRVATYSRPGVTSKPRVTARVEGRHTVIEIRMADGMGVFTAIVEALHGEGLDIHLARIDTMGGEIRDVFIVRKIGGGGIRTIPELTAVQKRLEDRLS
jgi:[protein-PII] uridylyltransferase